MIFAPDKEMNQKNKTRVILLKPFSSLNMNETKDNKKVNKVCYFPRYRLFIIDHNKR